MNPDEVMARCTVEKTVEVYGLQLCNKDGDVVYVAFFTRPVKLWPSDTLEIGNFKVGNKGGTLVSSDQVSLQ